MVDKIVDSSEWFKNYELVNPAKKLFDKRKGFFL